MPKMKLSCYDQSNRVPSMTKIWQDNDVTNRIGLVYAEIEFELSRPIWLFKVYDENQTRQRQDQSYRYDLHWKWNWATMSDKTGCSLWQKPYMITKWPIYTSGLPWNRNWIVGTNLTSCILWWKINRTTTWSIVKVQYMLKTKLSFRD